MGTYVGGAPLENGHDPVPSLLADGDEATSGGIQLLPLKIGYFMTTGPLEFETYFRYMINRTHTWDVEGSVTGTGSTSYRSYGGGVNAGVTFFEQSKFQMNLLFNGEYVLEKARLNFMPEAGGNEPLRLSTTAMIIGAGVQPEVWLGDLWVLSLFAGYQFGMESTWSVDESKDFMGRNFPAGDLQDSSGAVAASQFGGFLFELALKLNFYQ
jgi:hypothetical protein